MGGGRHWGDPHHIPVGRNIVLRYPVPYADGGAQRKLEEIIGNNIAKYRDAAGLTQAMLAEKIGISTAFISRVERGQKKMKVETLYATSKVLNVSVDALLSIDNSTAQMANIKQLLTGKSIEYLEGIEKIIRVCINEFEAKQKFPSES